VTRVAPPMSVRRRIRFTVEMARAFWWLAWIELGLRRGTLPALCDRLGIEFDLRSAAPPALDHVVLPRRTRTAVLACTYAVARWPFGSTCLRSCLVLGRRLRALQPVLRIGVRRDGELVVHSWLEIGDRTLDATSAQYATLGNL
jgi:Transglutaminase-like superfamily